MVAIEGDLMGGSDGTDDHDTDWGCADGERGRARTARPSGRWRTGGAEWRGALQWPTGARARGAGLRWQGGAGRGLPDIQTAARAHARPRGSRRAGPQDVAARRIA